MAESERVAVARAAAAAGAEVAAERFRGDLRVETKDGKTDVVTQADRAAQRAVVAEIRERYPDHAVVGEEADAATAVPETGPAWVVDPIDGTNNFVHGNRRWATSVAAVEDGRPVAAVNALPALGDTYVGTPDGVTRNGEPVSVSDRTDPETFAVVPTMWWGFDRRGEYATAARAIVERFGDLRRVGSAQAALSLLAAGAVEGVVTNVDAPPWDTIAGAALAEWAGGTVTDLSGDPWDHDSRGLVASNGTAHDELLAAARDLDDAR